MKAPAFQFYPSDWQRDMDDYPLEIEGAWIRICCRLYWSGGTATKTLEEWSKILRENKRKTQQIFDYFLLKNICDLVNQNGSITITSRRIIRDEYIRQIRKNAGYKGGNPHLKQGKNKENLVNQSDEQKLTPSSSSSSSSSSLKNNKNIMSQIDENALRLTSLFFDEITKENPKSRLLSYENVKKEKLLISWAKDIDKIIRLDKQEPSIVEEVIKFATHDDFWRANILSGQKLREKWDTLTMQMERQDKDSKDPYHGVFK